MKLIDPGCTAIRDEMAVLAQALGDLAPAANILEIGCGKGDMTRRIAERWPGSHITAIEVDQIQLAENQRDNRHPNIRFLYSAAQALPFDDQTFDAVLLFKSLHHVPTALLDRAVDEIHRVLHPGGIAYFCEPVFAGALNEITRLFHDEEQVRQAAFDALVKASADGNRWAGVDEQHYLAAVRYADFDDFKRKVMLVTHSDFGLTDELVAKVQHRFESYAAVHGAQFTRPMRADIFRKRS